MSIREGLTFDDVLLVPKFSDIVSRSQTDLTTQLSAATEESAGKKKKGSTTNEEAGTDGEAGRRRKEGSPSKQSRKNK